MLTELFFCYLCFLCLYVLFRLYRMTSFFKNEHVKTIMYRFYAVRDALIRLQIEGRMAADDCLLQKYYTDINTVLKYFEHVRKITISDILRLKDKLGAKEQQAIAVQIKAINDHPCREFRETVKEFHRALAFIILQNSTLKTLLQLSKIIAPALVKFYGKKAASHVFSFFSFTRLTDAFSFYKNQASLAV